MVIYRNGVAFDPKDKADEDRAFALLVEWQCRTIKTMRDCGLDLVKAKKVGDERHVGLELKFDKAS